MSKITMLRDRILVLPKPPEEVTASGFIIPDEAQDVTFSGTVEEVGPDAIVKKGDFVIFQNGAGMDISYEDRTLIIMRDVDVHCTFKA